MNLRAVLPSLRWIRRLALVLYSVAVLVATLAPLSGDVYEFASGLDKLVHLFLFAGIALLLLWNVDSVSRPASATVLAVTAVFAAAIEIVQGLLWYRSGDLWDLVAGCVGALIGVLAATAVAGIQNRPQHRQPEG